MRNNGPFIAIRTDSRGSRYDKTLGEYLVNPPPEDSMNVRTSTGGFFSDDDGVATADGSSNVGITVPAGGSVRIDFSTVDEYDDFTIGWTVEYTTSEGRIRESFSAGRMMNGALHTKNVPILGGAGRLAAFP